MELEFKTKNRKQLEATQFWIDNTTEEILYGGAKGGGKSFLGATLIFGDALIYPDTSYFIARKELIDLTNFTIPTIHKVFKNWGLNINDYASYNGASHCYTLTNGSKVYLIACKEEPSDPMFERFGSMEMTRGWIEEAGEVAENAKANLWLSIGRVNNDKYKLKKKLLLTANPKKGWMKRDFVDPFKQGVLAPSRKYIQAFATDNTYLPEDYVESLSNIKNKVARERLYEGNWDYEDDRDSLISVDALEDTFSNTIIKDGNKYLIVDVARLGKDTTVFSIWDGAELTKIDQFQQQATNVTEQKVKDCASINQIPYSHIIVDEDGIGGGVVDHLMGVKGFVANSSPLPTASQIRGKLSQIQNDMTPRTNFANLKTQCAFKLAEMIEEHKIAFKVPEYRDKIMEELTALLRQKNIDSDGKLQLRPKDEVKKEIGRSPDIGDTLIYRAWFELKKESMSEDPFIGTIILKQNNNFTRNRNNNNSTK